MSFFTICVVETSGFHTVRESKRVRPAHFSCKSPAHHGASPTLGCSQRRQPKSQSQRTAVEDVVPPSGSKVV